MKNLNFMEGKNKLFGQHLFLPRGKRIVSDLTCDKLPSRVFNKRGFGFLVSLMIVLVLFILASVLGLVFFGKIIDSFDSFFGAKWLFWGVLIFILFIFRQPIILIVNAIIKRVGI